MCGIVGLLTLPEAKLSQEAFAKALEQAEAFHPQISQLAPEALRVEISRLQGWIEELPGFSTAWALGEDPRKQEQIERIAAIFRDALRRVQLGQEHADGFHELEQWNQLGTLCRDLLWRLEQDILAGQQDLFQFVPAPWPIEWADRLRAMWQIEFVLRGLQRLEIRGRDSGGSASCCISQTAMPTTRWFARSKPRRCGANGRADKRSKGC